MSREKRASPGAGARVRPRLPCCPSPTLKSTGRPCASGERWPRRPARSAAARRPRNPINGSAGDGGAHPRRHRWRRRRRADGAGRRAPCSRNRFWMGFKKGAGAVVTGPTGWGKAQCAAAAAAPAVLSRRPLPRDLLPNTVRGVPVHCSGKISRGSTVGDIGLLYIGEGPS